MSDTQRHARDGALLPLGSKILNGGLMAVALLHLAYLGAHCDGTTGIDLSNLCPIHVPRVMQL